MTRTGLITAIVVLLVACGAGTAPQEAERDPGTQAALDVLATIAGEYTYEYAEAENIFKQLIKIDPSREIVVKHLEKSIRAVGSPIQFRTRAISIGLLFFAAAVIGVEILVVRPFYAQYADSFEFIRNALFILACLVTIYGEVIHRRRSREKVMIFHAQAKEKSK